MLPRSSGGYSAKNSRKDGGHDEACEGGIKASQDKMDTSQEALKAIPEQMAP
jgi:hypothetical protein